MESENYTQRKIEMKGETKEMAIRCKGCKDFTKNGYCLDKDGKNKDCNWIKIEKENILKEKNETKL